MDVEAFIESKHMVPFHLSEVSFDWTPSWSSGSSAWRGHFGFAKVLIDHLNPKIIVELGVHLGDSLWAFGEAAPSAQVFGVDTWEGDIHIGRRDPELFIEISELFKKLPNVQLLKMTFDEALSHFQEESIDLLHIDGTHTYEAVKNDFDSWLPKMAKGGVMLLHDIVIKEEPFGVWKLWEEIRAKYRTIEFSHSCGLGVIFL